MIVPSDIRRLSNLLPVLGIRGEYVERAVAYLCAGPDDEQRWGGVAVDYRDAGKFYAADAVFAVALDRFPNSVRMWQARADLFRRWEKIEGAIAFFLRTLELESSAVGSMLGLAMSYEQIECYAEAVKWYCKYLDKRPDNAQVHTNLANCYRQLARLEQARHRYEMALSIDPTNENALFSYAALLYEQREFDRALRLINQLIAFSPGDNEAQRLRAEILRRPTRPQQIGKQKLVNRAVIFRGSPSYGWQGPASNKTFTQTRMKSSGTEILSYGNLSKLDVQEIRSKFGYRTADVVELQRLVDERVSSEPVPAPNDYPIVFVSYRWSSAEHIEWVERFASALVERGYEVVFDRLMSENLPDVSVSTLVSSIAKCNLFVPILTNEYAIAAEPDGFYTDAFVAIETDQGAWVFDEFRTAKQLVAMGRMQYLPFWRSGMMLPSPFYEGNVVDVRTDTRYLAAMNRYFPHLR